MKPSQPSRRGFLGGLAAAAAGMLARPAQAAPIGPVTLRGLAGGSPSIGAAVPTNFMTELGPAKLRLLAEQFDSVTPENCLKWPVLSPREGVYRFDAADRVMELAAANGQTVVGHTLVFNRPGACPQWVFRDGKKEADARLVWKRIEERVATVMGRYAGRIGSWDVLNEFVEMNALGYRETDLTRVLGEDFPVRLFKLAAEIDPRAKLVYNDYQIEKPERRERILGFVRSLRDRGCRIDVVGSQSHLELDEAVGEQIDATIRACAAIDLRCAFTELDVDVVSRRLFWNPKTREQAVSQNPYVDGVPDDILERQARVYREVFAAVVANRRHVDRVTFWGVTDGDSWLNTWPWKRTNHALLFDRAGRPKPAFEAVASMLAGK
jgi:endo-1,4-beta-xylanase